jgi:DNA-binding response OmpR family regulator
MKQVLIINASPLFHEFLRDKLKSEGIEVETAERRDAFPKLVSSLPDLVIIDIESLEEFADLGDFFKKKKTEPNSARTPVIIAGPEIQREKVRALTEYGVIKYFTKPIKFDIFFETIGKILKAEFTLDDTHSIVDVHVNNNIIFIEIAQGLNREKLSLLKYKIAEIITKNNLMRPKVIVMFSDVEFSFVDGVNLEIVFDAIISEPRIDKRGVKILSFDPFVKSLIRGHKQYSDFEVCKDLSKIAPSLVEESSSESVTDLISAKILTADNSEEGSVHTQFYSENADDNSTGSVLRIAVVDDDPLVRKLLYATFVAINAECITFENGESFLKSAKTKPFDLVILDILMPGMTGFEALKHLREDCEGNSTTPVIIYSQVVQKESVVSALSMGAGSYLVKPQKPAVIVNKAMELLHPSAN